LARKSAHDDGEDYRPQPETKRQVRVSNDPSLMAIKKILTRYIGPMADIVCNHCLERKSDLLHPSRHEELIDILAKNIGSESERLDFRRMALSQIRRA
jgi:hypothetical protein